MMKYLASIALIGTIALGPSLAHAWAVPADFAATFACSAFRPAIWTSMIAPDFASWSITFDDSACASKL